jgi:phospholipid/cholesterol/gamma-HCH transport system substrate-binding protein
MSTIFDIRRVKLPRASRAAVTIGTLIVVFAVAAGFFGCNLYTRLTTNTVVAYFPETLALYPGDNVQTMGIKIGSIDKIEPAGDKMKVTFHYQNKYTVPASASASILNPSLVASREIQLAPAYTDGPVMGNNAVIPIERTQVPVEWDELRDQVTKIVRGLGPTPQQPKGPLGDIIESAANGLAGKGEQLSKTFDSLSRSLSALNEGRGDFFSVIRSLALFVNTLHVNDRQFAAFNKDFADLTGALSNSDRELASSVVDFNQLLATTRNFLSNNGDLATADITNLADTTTAILQPEPRAGLETGLHVIPNLSANLGNIYSPTNGALTAEAVFNNFANPMQLLCSAIQAGSRLGYQDSAELCAQYLAPILDAIKFNFPPFGASLFTTASTLPKQIAYSEDRLRPPPGYKDTTVPGIFARDTMFSHGNHEPGWVVAPGMQAVDLQPFTANMLTPESLSELMGGPDITPPNADAQSNPPPPQVPQSAPGSGPAAPPMAAERHGQ